MKSKQKNLQVMSGYPIMPGETAKKISFWRDDARVLIVHQEIGGFLNIDTDKSQDRWLKKIKKANLPLNHRFFALLYNNHIYVFMVEDMKDGSVYNWYDIAWLCCERDINLGVLNREKCPQETQEGRRHVHQVSTQLPTASRNQEQYQVSFR